MKRLGKMRKSYLRLDYYESVHGDLLRLITPTPSGYDVASDARVRISEQREKDQIM